MSDLERALAAEARLREVEEERKAAEARAKAEEEERKAAEARAKAEEEERRAAEARAKAAEARAKAAEEELEDYRREHEVMWGHTSATPSSVDSEAKLKRGRIESGTLGQVLAVDFAALARFMPTHPGAHADVDIDEGLAARLRGADSDCALGLCLPTLAAAGTDDGRRDERVASRLAAARAMTGALSRYLEYRRAHGSSATACSGLQPADEQSLTAWTASAVASYLERAAPALRILHQTSVRRRSLSSTGKATTSAPDILAVVENAGGDTGVRPAVVFEYGLATSKKERSAKRCQLIAQMCDVVLDAGQAALNALLGILVFVRDDIQPATVDVEAHVVGRPANVARPQQGRGRPAAARQTLFAQVWSADGCEVGEPLVFVHNVVLALTEAAALWTADAESPRPLVLGRVALHVRRDFVRKVFDCTDGTENLDSFLKWGGHPTVGCGAHVEARLGPVRVVRYVFVAGRCVARSPLALVDIVRDIGIMHADDWVHGDVRGHNMVCRDRRGKLIDFDYAGKAGSPYRVELRDALPDLGPRPDGARCGSPMRVAHDWEAVAKVIRLYRASARDDEGLWQAALDSAEALEGQARENPDKGESFFRQAVDDLVARLTGAREIEIGSDAIRDAGDHTG